MKLLVARGFYVEDEMRNLNHVSLLDVFPFCN